MAPHVAAVASAPPSTAVTLVDFRCENCGAHQTDVGVDYPEASVTCPDCEHTVDVGVYLGPDWHEEIEAERAAAARDDRLDAEIKDILREESADHDHFSE